MGNGNMVHTHNGRRPSMDEWVMEMWSIYAMEFHSVMKKNEIMELVGKWMELESTIVTKATQASKDQFCMLPLMCGPSFKYIYIYICIHEEVSVGGG